MTAVFESIVGLSAEVILPHGGAYGTRGKVIFVVSQIDPMSIIDGVRPRFNVPFEIGFGYAPQKQPD